jgi:hypothetical protein
MPFPADQSPVTIKECECLTPLGNARETHAALLRGERALKPVPVGGLAGGDAVPIALMPGRPLDEEPEPTWGPFLRRLLAGHLGSRWGSARRPVVFTSSNFGVGHLHAHGRTKDDRHLAYGSPFGCVDWFRRQMGWGENFAIFSHACVSAHLGIAHATRLVTAGLAEEVLVVTFDFISPFVSGGFHALKILNSDFPAPYQNRPTGSIGLGDGAAYAVIGPRSSGFTIKAQSLFNEMYHFTANQPDGAGFSTCFGSLQPVAEKLRLWAKGHGTGTIEAGRMESTKLAEAFPKTPLVGWKGSLGHTLGSCGLVELAIALEAVRAGVTPGTVGSAAPCFTENVALESFSNREFDGVLCASNAFGGAHASMIVLHD